MTKNILFILPNVLDIKLKNEQVIDLYLKKNIKMDISRCGYGGYYRYLKFNNEDIYIFITDKSNKECLRGRRFDVIFVDKNISKSAYIDILGNASSPTILLPEAYNVLFQ